MGEEKKKERREKVEERGKMIGSNKRCTLYF